MKRFRSIRKAKLHVHTFYDAVKDISPQYPGIHSSAAGSIGHQGIDVQLRDVRYLSSQERLSFLAAEVPDIAELDINPLMADASGCAAVDARILW